MDQKVIVETKVAKAIDPVHRAQVSNYLRASGLEVGLVVNFGSSVQFKRRGVAAPSATQPRMSRDPTTERQRQELTRMNDDHHDDADLFRGHLRISALTPALPPPVPRAIDGRT